MPAAILIACLPLSSEDRVRGEAMIEQIPSIRAGEGEGGGCCVLQMYVGALEAGDAKGTREGRERDERGRSWGNGRC